MSKSKEEKVMKNRQAIENEIRNMKPEPIPRNPKRKSEKFDYNKDKFIEDLNVNDFE